MAKLIGLWRLLKFFWNHGDQFMKMLKKFQSKVPQIVDAMRRSATAMETAAGWIGSAGSEVSNALQQAGTHLNAVNVPKLELTTSGFYDVLKDALNEILTPDPPEPSQNVKDRLNNVRVLNGVRLDGQIVPFRAFGDFFNLEGQEVARHVGSSETALEDTAKDFREIADILEAME
jgi:hypothetical protein